MDPSFDQEMATGRNGSIAPVHRLEELTLAPLPAPVLATVSANGCSGEWGPVRPRISKVCSTPHPDVASVGFRERVSQEMAGSSPPPSTLLCPVRGLLRPLGESSPPPGPDPFLPVAILVE